MKLERTVVNHKIGYKDESKIIGKKLIDADYSFFD